MKRYLLKVDALDIFIEVKRVKGLRLRVRPQGIFMSVPPGTSAEYCRRFVRENMGWVISCLQKQQQRKEKMAELTREKMMEYIEDFKPRFLQWQRKMNLYCTDVTFKDLTSRWGSCNYMTRKITINVKLALYPPQCTDYVIVHELAHLVHPNHSAAFWALVEKYMPDWRTHRAALKK
ncbi:MAG: M48 family metallopeptidase [Muribaculaceae bacterium]|nr:M48 family metallopeptidase [Muribaculaceae bacterium]